MCKDGAGARIILEQVTKEVHNLLARDFIICGSDNICKVKLNTILNGFIEFIKRVTHTNVIHLTSPCKYDLKGLKITLNNEIINIKERLLKLKKILPHLTVIEIKRKQALVCETWITPK